MDVFDGPYFQYKYLLTCLGVWPYQSKFTRRLFSSIVGLSSTLLLLAMAAGLMDEYSTDLVIIFETIVALFVIFGAFATCTMLSTRHNLVYSAVKCLYDEIAEHWRILVDEKELAILHTFSTQGRMLTLLYTVFTMPGYFIFAALTYVPILFDEKASKDYSHTFPYYFHRMIIDRRMHHYQVSFHAGLGLFYGGVTYVGIVAMYISSTKHICGLYAIVRYRLENLVKSKGKLSLSELRHDENIVPDLLAIVDTHKQAIKLLCLMKKIFSKTFFAVEICILLCLALLIFDVKYNLQNLRLMLRMFLVALIFILHVFYMNYGGEQIIQYSSDIHSAAYFMEWYTISNRARKFLLIIMLRSCKPDFLTAGTMSLSLENFSLIVKTSWSLATVLLARQKKSKYPQA